MDAFFYFYFGLLAGVAITATVVLWALHGSRGNDAR